MGPNLYLMGYIFWSSEFDTNKTVPHTSSILHTVVFIYLIYWLIQTDITCTTTAVLQYLSLVGSLKMIYIYIYIYICMHTYIRTCMHTYMHSMDWEVFENDSKMSNKSHARHAELLQNKYYQDYIYSTVVMVKVKVKFP